MKIITILLLLLTVLYLQSFGQIVIPIGPNDLECDPALLPTLDNVQVINYLPESAIFNLDISNCDEACTLTLVPSEGGEGITTGSGTSVTFFYPEDFNYQIDVETQLEYDVIIDNGVCEPTTISISFLLPFVQIDEMLPVEDLPDDEESNPPIVFPGVSGSAEIPTLGQWGLISSFLLLLIFPIVSLKATSIFVEV